MTPMIAIKDLSVSYAKKPALWSVDVDFSEGTLNGVVGPNGAGKSTLLKSMVGLANIVGGEVTFRGKKFHDYKNKISYMPQRDSVDWDFPADVWDLVMMGRDVKRGLFSWPSNLDRKIVVECLERVGLLPLKSRPLSSLSGGQRQRAFFARALAQEPEIFLLDEPFAGVDAATEKSLLALLRHLSSVEKKTIVVVHHDLSTARKIFDNILLLNTRLIDFGPASNVLSSDNIEKAYGVNLNLS